MRIPVLLACLALAGCVDPFNVPEPARSGGGAGAYSVQLYNEGSVTLRNIRVTTGQDVPPLTRAELLPGERSGTALVSMVHEHPIVSATVNGAAVTAHPVEGFSGFNAQLPAGAYVVKLRWNGAYATVEARVERIR